jgi:hypothetical protein
MSTPEVPEVPEAAKIDLIRWHIEDGSDLSAAGVAFLLEVLDKRDVEIKRLTARVTDLRAMRRREGF